MKYFLRVIILLTFSLHETSMCQNTNIDKQYIKIELNNAIADISINGIPFIKNLDTDSFITTEPVNLWLKNGENTLSYTIYADEDTENYSPSLSASVFIHDEKQEIPTPLETLTTIHYVGMATLFRT